jgi:hypothetical protein
MNKHAPYEHEHVEGFDKLENIEVCVDMEEILQPTQTQQMEATLQQTQTQKNPQKIIVKVPKVSLYSKRSSSEAMDLSDWETSPKKMKITQSPQIVDLEEEYPKEQVNMDMVESGTNTVEFEKRRKLQSEGSSRTLSNKKNIFDKTSRETYQSKEDLEKQYVEKGNMAMGEMRELVPEVENISQHKSSLSIVTKFKVVFRLLESKFEEFKAFNLCNKVGREFEARKGIQQSLENLGQGDRI